MDRRVHKRGPFAIFCLLLAVGCGSGGDARSEELWIIDFDTYGDEIAATVLDLDLDHDRLIESTMDQLREFYVSRLYPGGFAITFQRGIAQRSSLFSSICVRWGPDSRVGRAKLDLGNDDAEFNCGSGNDGDLGVFVDTLSFLFRPQLADRDFTREQRTVAFAQLLALVLAHEIGHSLGLQHTDGIMAPFPDFSIGFQHQFSPAQERILQANIVR